jgi:tetratricopeptide (TPR) repeat protein
LSKQKQRHDRVAGIRSVSPPTVRANRSLFVSAGICLISAAVFFVYRPALHGGFVLDDDVLLTQNSLLKSSRGLYQIWFTTAPVDYWPVMASSFWFEWRLWGDDPTGYHITNLALHIAESLLVWLILWRLRIAGAFLAAIVFALHPVNVESVAWIAQRKNLLAMLFFLLSILSFVIGEDRRASAGRTPQRFLNFWDGLSLVTFVMAMLSKGSVVVLPVVLLLIIWWRRPLAKWDFARMAPFFVVGGFLTLLNMWFQTHGAQAFARNVGFIERTLGAAAVIWFYLGKALLPINLAFVYPQWYIHADELRWWLPLAAVIAATAALWSQRHRPWGSAALLAWAYFCVSLAPVMGFADIAFMNYSLVADHYQHLAIIGPIALAAAAWSYVSSQTTAGGHLAAIVVASSAVVALACLTLNQSRIYEGPFTLYEATLAANPNAWLAHDELGNTLIKANRPDEAIAHFNRSLQLNPQQPKVHNNIGIALVKMGKLQEAQQQFEQALHLQPDFAEAQHYLGLVLMQIHQPDEAIAHFRRAIELKENYPEAYDSLGQALLEMDRVEAAILCFEQSCHLDPDNADARAELAISYKRVGRLDDATRAAQQALELARSQGKTMLLEQLEKWLKMNRPQPSPPPAESKTSAMPSAPADRSGVKPTVSAPQREETRGAHVRTDFRTTDDDHWQRDMASRPN